MIISTKGLVQPLVQPPRTDATSRFSQRFTQRFSERCAHLIERLVFLGWLVLSHGMCIWSWFEHWSVTMGYTGVPPKIAISLCNRWFFKQNNVTFEMNDQENRRYFQSTQTWWLVYHISRYLQYKSDVLEVSPVFSHIYVWKRIEKYLQNIFRILLEDWLSISCSVHLGLAPWILEMDCCGNRLSQVSHHWLWVRMKHSNLHDMISTFIIQLKFVGMVIPISWCSFFWRWLIFQTRRWWEDE